MNNDRAGINVTWIPVLTPLILNGKIIFKNVVLKSAPKSYDASIKFLFIPETEL